MTKGSSTPKKPSSLSRGGKRGFSVLLLCCFLVFNAAFAAPPPDHIIAGFGASAAAGVGKSLGLNSFIGGSHATGGLQVIDDQGVQLTEYMLKGSISANTACCIRLAALKQMHGAVK